MSKKTYGKPKRRQHLKRYAASNRLFKGKPTPPLSKLDQCLYFLGVALWFAMLFVLAIFGDNVSKWIALSDSGVLAYTKNSSDLLSIPLFMYLLISGITLFCAGYFGGKPIFGNKKINYNEYRWETVRPLLGPLRAKTPPKTRKQEPNLAHLIALIWLVLLIPGLLLAPLSLSGRTCIREDGSIVQYTCLNHPVREYEVEDIAELTVSSSYYSRRNIYQLEYETKDGRSYVFRYNGFRGTLEENLISMIGLKEMIPPVQIQIEEEVDLKDIIREKALSEEEAALLYELFEQP